MTLQNHPPVAILEEAADWLVRFQSGDTSAKVEEFEAWRQQSAYHAEAWQRAEQLQQTFGQVPNHIGKATFSRIKQTQRRKLLQGLGILLAAGPAAWATYRGLPWEDWSADYHTATGEQQTVQLSDGTTLALNTNTAINIQYVRTQREIILLHGEIMVETGHADTQHRRFIVTTRHAQLTALGTRFNVHAQPEQSQLAVLEGKVRIALPGGESRTLQAGEQADFNASAISATQAVNPAIGLWQHGMLLAQDMPLGLLINELNRYHRGILRCHPAISELHVSGAFPLMDTRASLDMLRNTLPLEIHSITRYWVTIAPLKK